MSGWGNVTLFSGSDPAHRPHTHRGGPKTDWRVISEEQLRGKLESVSRKDGGKEWKCSLWRTGKSRWGEGAGAQFGKRCNVFKKETPCPGVLCGVELGPVGPSSSCQTIAT